MPNPDAVIKLKGQGVGQHGVLKIPLGDGPIMPTAGGPTIEELARAGRSALTYVTGSVLLRLDVPIFLDGITKRSPRENVKPELTEILELAAPPHGGPLPDFTAEGPLPYPYSGERFIMDWPEWGRLIPFPSGEGLLQAELVLKLVQFEDPRSLKPHKRGQGKVGLAPNRAVGTITLDRPENLVEVAGRYTNDPGEAKTIGKANGIHDLKRKLPKGTRLTIPAG